MASKYVLLVRKFVWLNPIYSTRYLSFVFDFGVNIFLIGVWNNKWINYIFNTFEK